MRTAGLCCFRRLGVLLVVAAVLGVPGCDQGPRRFSVSGQVTLNGVPLSAGTVSFVGQGNAAGKGLIAGTIKDGAYSVTTDGKGGAPLGTYKVTVVTQFPGAPADAPVINPLYADPVKTPLKVTVVENPEPGVYDLKLTK
jgi:hypothetical protein